jgi:hypothetical protein
MSIAYSKKQFQSLFERKYGKQVQLELEFIEDVKEPEYKGLNKKLRKL